MRIIIRSDAEAACVTAARIIADQITRKPNSVLGLATGGTPLGCYRELIRLYRQGLIDFAEVTTFNLDEYVGLGPEHPQSYHRFMRENLFQYLNLPADRSHLPDGQADDMQAACAAYERSIIEADGIDLQLLGIGSDGHIAFNEPGSSLASRTRVKTLCRQTIDDNARFFDSIEQVPRLAVTMGVGTILDSARCLLLATGKNKAAAIQAAIEGPVTSQNTASALQLHPDVIAVLDAAAASMLTRQQAYNDAEAHMPDPDHLDKPTG